VIRSDACGGVDCPFTLTRNPALEMPVGRIRRVAAADGEVDETKRNILKLAAVAGVVALGAGATVGGALKYVQPPVVGLSSYPKVLLLDTDGSPLTIGKGTLDPTTGLSGTTEELYIFDYPLRNEPNFLLNLYPLATNVPNGIGPNGSIVAYSAVCQHLGCTAPSIAYYPPGKCSETPGGRAFYIHCSCHGSTYDAADGAANLTGPAVIPLPQVILSTPSSGPQAGQVFANYNVGAPVKGHINTLQGDYGVGNTSQIVTETATFSCNFLT
jgi:Rieske Fe-S protein